MSNQQRKMFWCFVLSFIVIIPCITIAQEAADHLVITQVYLDSSRIEGSWLEVYNPTEKPLILERLRMSHFKTINILPKAIQDSGGIEIGAGEYIIICGNEKSFKSSYGEKIKNISADALSRLASGGFIAITTKGAGESKGAVVRYGDPDKSGQVLKLAGSQVLNLSKKGKSYLRKISKLQSGITVSDFTEIAPSPGKPIE